MTTQDLTPEFFTAQQAHANEVIVEQPETLEQFWKRHCAMTRHAYVVTDDLMVQPVIVLSNGQIERSFIPVELDTMAEFIERSARHVTDIGASRYFFSRITPANALKVGGETTVAMVIAGDKDGKIIGALRFNDDRPGDIVRFDQLMAGDITDLLDAILN